MGKLVGVIASVLTGLLLATGVGFGLSAVSGPDEAVDFSNPPVANDPNDVRYGNR
ncbi:hypothetical protein H0B56_21275 [Haloechinothrix sp. YIM 98757]|uniref:DUF2613 domain-containing protein n=1 Tax=Haloechinothrix aidingensis TaxID=2752311 RepID=A0A838AG04_9PSEU|nr:hypothetical protein [Haloechinothrix aidingensis]MBA0128085.1 hypothetical protein [Haloechinothrix aidingensis]